MTLQGVCLRCYADCPCLLHEGCTVRLLVCLRGTEHRSSTWCMQVSMVDMCNWRYQIYIEVQSWWQIHTDAADETVKAPLGHIFAVALPAAASQILEGVRATQAVLICDCRCPTGCGVERFTEVPPGVRIRPAAGWVPSHACALHTCRLRVSPRH